MNEDAALACFIASVLPNLSAHQLLLDALKTLGVESLEDMKYVKEEDLLSVLRPIEARKLIARFKAIGKYTRIVRRHFLQLFSTHYLRPTPALTCFLYTNLGQLLIPNLFHVF